MSRSLTEQADILADETVLYGSWTPEVLPEHEMELDGNDIHDAPAPVARGASPHNAFIYEKTGQGKTVGVTHKLDDLRVFAGNNDIDVCIVRYSSTKDNLSYQIIANLVAELSGEKPRGWGFVLSHVREDIVANPGIGKIGAFDWIVWVSAFSLKLTARKVRVLSTSHFAPRLSCDCLADVCPPSHDVIVAVVVASNHRTESFLFEFVATEVILNRAGVTKARRTSTTTAARDVGGESRDDDLDALP